MGFGLGPFKGDKCKALSAEWHRAQIARNGGVKPALTPEMALVD